MKAKKSHERLNLICECDRCVKASSSGGRSSRSAARSRDGDLREFLDMPQERALRAVRLAAQHGVAWLAENGPLPLGVATLLAYHSGCILLGNQRPRTCILVRPKGYASEWLESVDAAREALKAPKHRAAEVAASSQLDLFGGDA